MIVRADPVPVLINGLGGPQPLLHHTRHPLVVGRVEVDLVPVEAVRMVVMEGEDLVLLRVRGGEVAEAWAAAVLPRLPPPVLELMVVGALEHGLLEPPHLRPLKGDV